MSVTEIDKYTAELHIENEPIILEVPRPQQNTTIAQNLLPPVTVRLEWIYGYRGKDSFKTLLYVKESNEIVYFTGGIVILQNLKKKTQRFFRRHDSFISSINQSTTDLNIIATGQESGKHKKYATAKVFVWRADNLDILMKMEPEPNLDINHVCFSNEGDNLGIVFGERDTYQINILSWKTNSIQYKSNSITSPIKDIHFVPNTDKCELVTLTKGELFNWTISDNKIHYKKISVDCLPDSHDRPFFISFNFSPKGQLTAGDSCGNILIWKDGITDPPTVIFSSCESPISCIFFLSDDRMYTGHKNGFLSIWGTAFYRMNGQINLCHTYGSAKTIVEGPKKQIFVGTDKNFILNGDINLSQTLQIVVFGHADNLNAISKGNDSMFVTGGKDKRVFIWNAITNKAVSYSEVRFQISSVGVSACGQFVAVGGVTGQWSLINGFLGHSFQTGKACNFPITCIEFSPVGSYVAFGAQNGEVYIYHVTENSLSEQGKLSQPYGPVTHIDWAVDSKYIRTCSENRHIFYWTVPKCTQEKCDYVMYDHYWYTKNCNVTYLSSGIWDGSRRLFDINSVDVGHGEKTISFGDNFGIISTLIYPTSILKNDMIETDSGHGSIVKSLKYLKGVSKLITIGGDDHAIFQWQVQLRPITLESSFPPSDEDLSTMTGDSNFCE